jgi:fimbrial isopeptide formation D2 family protein/LPXTG-motif cell wall-anchored protein
MKKILALTLVLIMALSLATTAFAATATVTVAKVGHTYEAYQILTGSQGESETALGDVAWGTGMAANSAAFLTELKNNATVGETFKDAVDAKSFAEAMAKLTDNSEGAKIVAAIADKHKVANSGVELKDGKNTVDDGYYLIVDITNLSDKHDSKNASLLQVTRDITIADKSSIPEVDKQVWDEEADAEANHTNGWGETADHFINESFQFKLIATLSADEDYAEYEKYKIVFTDTMSAGVTFESIESVKVDGIPVDEKTGNETNKYEYTATAGQAGGSWTLTIEDIKGVAGVNLVDGAIVEVIYNAHLNENAVVGDIDENKNTVYLEYSNNPNVGGENELGKTTEDTVWVFTYEVDSTKYADEIKTGKELPGAGFTLYTTTDGTTKGNPVKLVFDTTKNAYRPASAAEIADDVDAEVKKVVTEMTSAADGKFNVIGLDVGTYIMEETNVPAGYNKCADITIEITAVHEETDKDNAKTNITMKKDNVAASQVDVVNKSGAVLPETGGMGTTIFYIVGGLLAVAAVVLLITKKRMSSAE